jgi:antitoxin component YwqK of YwqJK toxin-antitoxin module
MALLKQNFFKNKQLKQEFFENNYKKEGEYKEYFYNGQIKISCNYIDDKLNGEYTEYFDNGQIKISCNYIDDKLNDEYKEYYFISQNLLWKLLSNIINNIQINKYFDKKIYDDNYDYFIKIRCFYINGLKQGKYIEFNKKGIIIEYSNYKDDMLNGECNIGFIINSNSNIISNIGNSLIDSVSISIDGYVCDVYENDKDCTHIEQCNYVNNLKEGISYVYDYSHKLYEIREYKNNILYGTFFKFKNNILYEIKNYINGQKIKNNINEKKIENDIT